MQNSACLAHDEQHSDAYRQAYAEKRQRNPAGDRCAIRRLFSRFPIEALLELHQLFHGVLGCGHDRDNFIGDESRHEFRILSGPGYPE
jgi:hypothetical protein